MQTKTKTIKVVGQAEDGAIRQANNCLAAAEAFCLMADNHKGYGMPVGGVAVYRDKVSPAGVGFDIACGNKAVQLNIKRSDIADRLGDLADEIYYELSFGIGLNNRETVDHELFDSPTWELDFYSENPSVVERAHTQLGTIGAGNHYVDVFYDESDNVWIGVHFGSRGLGHKTATHFMGLAGDNPNIMDETPHLLGVHSEAGLAYLSAMELAGQYAYAGRDWVCAKVAELIGADIVDEVHNHHNFAWQESHHGQEHWVVRKGATPAFPGQRGFIGGSMAENAVIVRGVDSEESRELYFSTVHGAGRVMSRTQAAGRTRWKTVWGCTNDGCGNYLDNYNPKRGRPNPTCSRCGSKMEKRRMKLQIKKGAVDFDAVKKLVKSKGIELRGGGADESPQVYKRLDEVLGFHAGTIDVLHTLTPMIVCMAGDDIVDPYKD